MWEETKRLCDSFLEMGVPGFDLIAYHKGEEILRYHKGFSDREEKIPVNGKERYYIYSCSKPITCTAAMQLWEKGAFSLEDPLAKYLPEFSQMQVKEEDGTLRPAKGEIQIQNLFSMTAGFSYNVTSPSLMELRKDTEGRCPTREAMRYLAKEPLLFDPGDQYRYSLCHDVLAALVEEISGERFEVYVKKNIFEPLGMTHSEFLYSASDLSSSRPVPIYRRDPDSGEIVRWEKGNTYILGTEYASGGAGCVSTVEDYIRFAEALRRGDSVIGKETVRLMTTDRLNERQKETFSSQIHGYGLGMRAPLPEGARKDFGWGGAAGAFLAVDPTNEITLFYAQSVLNSPNVKLRGTIYTTLLKELLGVTAPEMDLRNTLC